jgi:two-component system, OmpR family, response regulator
MDGSTKNIFIIDDDKFLLDMYALKFTDSGFTVSANADAQEALSKIEAGFHADVILLDIVMPGMDGFAFLEELQKRRLAGNTILVILSNLGQKEDIEKGLHLGAHGYIVKASSTPSEVVEKVKQIMKEHKN